MEIEETMEECKSIHCDVCGAVFTTKSNMLRHKRMSHGQRVLYVCNTCGTTFTRMDNLRHHEKKMHAITHREKEEQRFECSHCKARFLTEKHLNEHIKRMHRSSETYLCHTCGQVFNQKKPFMKHIKHHRVALATSPTKRVRRDDSREQGKPLQSIGACELPPHIDPDGCIASMYREHWCHIRDRQSVGRVFRWYNFHLPAMNNDVLREKATTVFSLQSTAFKINASYGFVLFNNETNECRHYYASRNTKLFNEPFLVRDTMSFQKFMDALLSEDVLEYARSLRPDSKWVVQHITNVTFYVARLTDHPIGKSVDLPSYVSHNQAIISLSKNRNSGHAYDDNLCLFRCIALAKGYDGKSLEKMTKSLFCHYCPDTAVHEFKGVKLSDLHKIEELFEINVVVYELHPVDTNEEGVKEEDDRETGQVTATLVRRSLEKFSDTIFLNLFGNHFSYIVDIERYCQSYQCRKCNKLWKTRKSLLRHETTCNASGTSFIFPKGLSTFHNPPTIWEELADEGIVVDESRRFFPYFATFDMESYLEKVKNELDTQPGKLQYISRHIPMSVSINSNVPGYTDPFCTVSEGDPLLLIDTMVTYLLEVSQRSLELLESKYADVMERIEEKITKWTDHSEENGNQVSTKPTHLTKLKQKFVSFLSELPVIGFNSGRYDINAIKEFLYPCLLQKDPVDYVIKRNHNHMALKTKHLQFLDISNFLAPGFSYAAFLKAYDCEEGKGYFPHGWLDSLDKLNNCELPPIEAFRNNLSRTEFSDKQYEYCQRVWEEHKMTSLKDYLVWYNNQDVTPFIEAIEKMRAFYKNLKIDLFKDGISVPGLTMKYLMKCSPDAHFSLISDKDKDLYHTFRENLVGGPSIIFHRYHERGVTRIRGGKLCQKVIGFDANALYLWAIMQHMPTGHYIRRRRENDFKPEFKPPIAQEWLQYESYRRQLPIRHAGNHSEKRLGPLQIPVDGFCGETKQVFEFNGCYFHGHPCHLTKGQPFNKKLGKPMSELLKKTEEKRKYIESLGYQYISIWECEYRELRKFDHSLSAFLSARFPPPKFRHGMTQDQLISSIANGQLFGFVQCDIHVPDNLKECFSEMCPIFKNVDITREDIGDVMRSHAEEHGIMNTPRRSLIGSMFGENILLFTPLLQWYLNHGLVVTNISQFVEYEPVACFKQFGENVSDARRKGDVDPSKSIIADTMKLIGNSSYGKTITNKLKHRNVKICDENGAQKCINNIRYRDLNPISEDCFEVDMAKRKISLDLPVQIGHAVYQLAKLRMLQFYFDFLLRYVDSSDFQMCEMDTDSAYIAISSYNFQDIIKPHMRKQFEEDKCNWFPRNDTPENAMYDKRTPGLFKVEWEGDGIIALCSKTYYCFGATDKFSCKGINKKQNNITKDVYLEVLRSKVAGGGVNKGFRVVQNGISTYSQARNAFSYFYPKRKVLEDNISTTYLDI